VEPGAPCVQTQPKLIEIHIDFVQLNVCTGELVGWLIPNILKVLEVVQLPSDFTSGYHQTHLHEKSRDLSAFITADGLYQWTRVAMGLKGAWPYFQRSIAKSSTSVSCILTTCEEKFLANLRQNEVPVV